MKLLRKYRVPLIVIAMLLLIKFVWVAWACRGVGSFETEKKDLLERRNFLKEKIIVAPSDLINSMPSSVGAQFQGEWALYSCSMTAEALTNLSRLYPETLVDARETVDSLIKLALSPELRGFDWSRWNEDPLKGILTDEDHNSDKGHLPYRSHLAWIIGNYKALGGDNRYDEIYHRLCEELNRHILASPSFNMPTYPGEPVYIPDMLVAIVALNDYNHFYKGRYKSTVDRWLSLAKSEWTDESTGLLASILNDDGSPRSEIKGSYSSLNCYFLTKLNNDFAFNQYILLKYYFSKRFPTTGIKEYHDRSCLIGMDVDAGPVIFNLSPSATAFAIGSATYFGDNKFRRKLLKTAEIAGHTVASGGKRHYLLDKIALVGEPIMLAMRTNRNSSTNSNLNFEEYIPFSFP